MESKQFQDFLKYCIIEGSGFQIPNHDDIQIQTLEEVGLEGYGLIVTFPNGSEYRVFNTQLKGPDEAFISITIPVRGVPSSLA